jgi:molecular chaperone GrpE
MIEDKKNETVDLEKTNSEQEPKEAVTDEKNVVDKEELPPVTPEEESFRTQFLRLNADMQNYKRRIEKERLEWMQFSQSQILNKLLPIFDDLDRALDFSKDSEIQNKEKWIEGFKLIQKNWQKELTDIGIEEITTTGKFNPEEHEALMQVESGDKKTGEVVQTLSKGYKFKGTVIRHAKVSVKK